MFVFFLLIQLSKSHFFTSFLKIMSEIIEITEKQFVDTWEELKLGGRYVRDKDRIVKHLCDIFANFGLKIIDFKSKEFNTIRRRYQHISKKILENKKVSSRSKYHGLKCENVFYSAAEFPDICENDSTKR